jgi:signal transduction histidine kinase
VAVDMVRSGAHDYLLKGNLHRLIPAVTREITEARTRRASRQAEAALRESEERLKLALRESAKREAEANRGKDEFLANLSHELRTPLNVILGYARILASAEIQVAEPNAERFTRIVSIVERNAAAQLRIVEDLLDVQRIVAGHFGIADAPCDLRELGQTVVDSLLPSAAAKRLRLDVRLEPVDMVCDGPRIQQVIWNLLSNAIKFTPDDGYVAVRLTENANHVVIRIEDNGEGIPAGFLPHVFDRFRQLDMSTTRRHSGMGLGLAIARHIVDLHGGTILAESDGPGLGSTFTVTLPHATERRLRPILSADVADLIAAPAN